MILIIVAFVLGLLLSYSFVRLKFASLILQGEKNLNETEKLLQEMKGYVHAFEDLKGFVDNLEETGP